MRVVPPVMVRCQLAHGGQGGASAGTALDPEELTVMVVAASNVAVRGERLCQAAQSAATVRVGFTP